MLSNIKALAYAQDRKTMGQAIINHQQVAALLADMTTGVEAARMLVHKSCYEVPAWLNTVSIYACDL